MPRRPDGPWIRKSRQEWYATIGGKDVRLQVKAPGNESEARKAWHRLMAEGPKAPETAPAALTLGELRDLFLAHVEREWATSTLEFYFNHTKYLCESVGADTPAADVRQLHVTRHTASRNWAQSTRHQSITVAKAMFSWAKREGHLAEDHIASMKRPGMTTYQGTLMGAEVVAIRDAALDRPFRDYLTALYESGARSSEIMRLEAKHVSPDGRTLVLPGKTSRKTGRPRVIEMTERCASLVRERAAEHPEGPIFRNADGNPWNRNSVRCRFRRLRGRVAIPDATSKAYRHSFATDALERGVPIATVAELLGHADTTMVSRVYSKLHERREHLSAAANAVRPAAPSPPATTGTAPAGPVGDAAADASPGEAPGPAAKRARRPRRKRDTTGSTPPG